MAFGVITNGGDVMPLFIYSHHLTLHTEAHVEYLKGIVLLWIKRVVVRRPC